MKPALITVFLIALSLSGLAQGPAQKIYETERAFEKMVAEKGMNAGFVEFMAPDGVMFFPQPENARAIYSSRPPSPAALTWNPILIDVASNGILAYSIGNSVFRPKGKDDATSYSGHYISVWVRQPSGEYRAVLDTGINHEAPATVATQWRSGTPGEGNPKGISAADSSSSFYVTAAENLRKAYKDYLASDAIIMRDGAAPYVGKDAANKYFSSLKGKMNFAKRRSFLESVDLAYVHSGYTLVSDSGTTLERGNFVHVWKLIGGRWQIVAEVLIPIPEKK